MKTTIKVIFLGLIFCSGKCFAQNGAELLAQKQAQRMKDSIGISEQQKNQVFQVNMQIHQRKMAARANFVNDSLQMKLKIQQYESERDSLYQAVIDSDEKYLLYKQKKNQILRAN